MNQREVELRRAEMETANFESNLLTDIARLENSALELQSRAEALKLSAARLDPTASRRLEGVFTPSVDLGAQREAALDARAEALNMRIQANERLKRAVQAFSADLSRMAQLIQQEDAALQQAEHRAREQAARQAEIAKTAPVPAPVAQPAAPSPSPKAPAAAMPAARPSEVARRAQARVLMQASVDMSSETNFFNGFSTNISDGGIFIATVKHVPIGTEVDLSFTLPSGQKIQAQGVVRWTREVNDRTPEIFPGVGVQFKGLNDDVQAAIHKFVASREPMFFPD